MNNLRELLTQMFLESRNLKDLGSHLKEVGSEKELKHQLKRAFQKYVEVIKQEFLKDIRESSLMRPINEIPLDLCVNVLERIQVAFYEIGRQNDLALQVARTYLNKDLELADYKQFLDLNRQEFIREIFGDTEIKRFIDDMTLLFQENQFLERKYAQGKQLLNILQEIKFYTLMCEDVREPVFEDLLVQAEDGDRFQDFFGKKVQNTELHFDDSDWNNTYEYQQIPLRENLQERKKQVELMKFIQDSNIRNYPANQAYYHPDLDQFAQFLYRNSNQGDNLANLYKILTTQDKANRAQHQTLQKSKSDRKKNKKTHDEKKDIMSSNSLSNKKKVVDEIREFEERLEADTMELRDKPKLKPNISEEWIKKLQVLQNKKSKK